MTPRYSEDSFIYKYFLSVYNIPGSVLGTGVTVMNRKMNILALMELTF